MKIPKFTPEQMEYIQFLTIGRLTDEVWKAEYNDADSSKMQFRAGQRDGIRMVYEQICVEQEKAE
jgi:hypothetical protein